MAASPVVGVDQARPELGVGDELLGSVAEDPLDLRAHVGQPATVRHAGVGHVDVHRRRDVLDEHPVARTGLGQLELRRSSASWDAGPVGRAGRDRRAGEREAEPTIPAMRARSTGRTRRSRPCRSGASRAGTRRRQDRHGQPAERGREARGPVHARRLGGSRAAHHHQSDP